MKFSKLLIHQFQGKNYPVQGRRFCDLREGSNEEERMNDKGFVMEDLNMNRAVWYKAGIKF